MIDPGEITIGAVAAELGGQGHFADFRAAALGPGTNFRLLSNIPQRDPLVLINEENRALRGLDDLLDLVFTQVLIKAGALVETVGFVDDQHIHAVAGRFRVGAGALEQVGDVAFLETARQLAFVDGARGRVARDVVGQSLALRAFDQQVELGESPALSHIALRSICGGTVKNS